MTSKLRTRALRLAPCVLLVGCAAGSPKGRLWLMRGALVLVSVALSAGLLEAALRIHAAVSHVTFGDVMESHKSMLAAIPADRNVSVRAFIQPNENPHIVYELVPECDVTFHGQPVRINAWGFRGGATDLRKEEGSLRIVGLGDSVMFGWGVREEQCYLSLLGDKIRARYPDLELDIINTGVPGYNTVMEVEAFKAKWLVHEPDIVIIDYVPNDLQLPNFLTEPSQWHDPSRSFLVDFVWTRLKRMPWTPSFRMTDAPLQTTDAPLQTTLQQSRQAFENDPQRVPERYREMVGIDAYRRAMTELVTLSEKHGFELVVMSHSAYPDDVSAVLDELELPRVPGAPVFGAYLQERDIEDYLSSVLVLSEPDPHPSPLGHRLLAEALFDFIDDRHWLARTITP